jgi:hypothetical protein
MADRSQQFVDLSALLTGFDRVDVFGTGMAEDYLSTLGDVLPAGALDELLAAHDRVAAAPDPAAAVASEILGDPKLGPLARNVILLWYCGAWTELPDDWRAAYGASPLDGNRVVSGAAYESGLQWIVAGAHPAGARQQGYGAWAAPPRGSGG